MNASIYIQFGSTGLGLSSTVTNPISYTDFRNALSAHQTDASDVTAFTSSVPATNPINASYLVRVTNANARALGFTANTGLLTDGSTYCTIGTMGCYDGIITISSTVQAAGHLFYRAGSITASQYDFYTVVEHETDEVLGTASCAFPVCNASPQGIYPADLYRYSSDGTRSFAAGNNTLCSASNVGNACFSIDGVHMLQQYNNLNNGQDAGDWAPNCITPRVQNATGCPGVANVDISPTAEILVLDVVGYTLGSQHATDFNGDGHPDVVWQDPVSGLSQVFYVGGLQGVTFLGASVLSGSNSWRIVAIADLNQDGHPDVVWQDPNSGSSAVWFMGGTGGTTYLGSATLSGSNPWRIVAAGDFNLDGHPDLVWQDPVSGQAQIWFLGGTQGAQLLGTANLTMSNPWHIVGAGDFNSDGHPDLLWQDPASGATQVWYLGGAQGNVVQTASTLSGVNPWRIAMVQDFNLDGHPDVVWQDPNSGSSAVWFMGGTGGATYLGSATLSGSNPWRIIH